MARQLFVGDIHGHYEALRQLWDLISPTSTDAVYFLGDLIDRGPDSAAVVDFVAMAVAAYGATTNKC
jgi:serine/threonine protein phosphatase 1